MKTLLERIEKLVASVKDWYNGKEHALHTEHASVAYALAVEVEKLQERCKRLEDRLSGIVE